MLLAGPHQEAPAVPRASAPWEEPAIQTAIYVGGTLVAGYLCNHSLEATSLVALAALGGIVGLYEGIHNEKEELYFGGKMLVSSSLVGLAASLVWNQLPEFIDAASEFNTIWMMDEMGYLSFAGIIGSYGHNLSMRPRMKGDLLHALFGRPQFGEAKRPGFYFKQNFASFNALSKIWGEEAAELFAVEEHTGVLALRTWNFYRPDPDDLSQNSRPKQIFQAAMVVAVASIATYAMWKEINYAFLIPAVVAATALPFADAIMNDRQSSALWKGCSGLRLTEELSKASFGTFCGALFLVWVGHYGARMLNHDPRSYVFPCCSSFVMGAIAGGTIHDLLDRIPDQR